jgi:hypothetical protein
VPDTIAVPGGQAAQYLIVDADNTNDVRTHFLGLGRDSYKHSGLVPPDYAGHSSIVATAFAYLLLLACFRSQIHRSGAKVS